MTNLKKNFLNFVQILGKNGMAHCLVQILEEKKKSAFILVEDLMVFITNITSPKWVNEWFHCSREIPFNSRKSSILTKERVKHLETLFNGTVNLAQFKKIFPDTNVGMDSSAWNLIQDFSRSF